MGRKGMQRFLKSCLSTLVLLQLISVPVVTSQNVFVNRCGGVPIGAPGAGSQNNPFSQISTAASQASPGSTLNIKGDPFSIFASTYAEPVTIQKRLTLTASNGPVWLLGQPASTRKVCQLTGQNDKERNAVTINLTETKFHLKGTDLGASFEHNGRIYFLFGDTVPTDASPNRPFNADSIAWVSQNADPEQCLTLNFVTGSDTNYLSPQVINPDGTVLKNLAFETPIAGLSAGGSMYVFFTTDHHTETNKHEYIGRLVLARLVDEAQNRFTYVADVSCRPGTACSFPDGTARTSVGNFINVSPILVNNSEIADLPRTTGQGVLLWGTGSYRESDPYLAYIPLDGLENPR